MCVRKNKSGKECTLQEIARENAVEKTVGCLWIYIKSSLLFDDKKNGIFVAVEMNRIVFILFIVYECVCVYAMKENQIESKKKTPSTQFLLFFLIQSFL